MKKLLIVLFAGLLLISAVACTGEGEGNETGNDTNIVIPNGTDESGAVITDAEGNVVTNPVEEGTQAPQQDNVSEQNPTFTDCEKTLYVWVATATIRSATVIGEENGIAWPTEGTTLTCTGESNNWYRIQYEDKTAYIAKTVAGDYAAISGMTTVDNEEIEISADVNVRTYPSTEGGDLTLRGSLKKGTKVTRVAKGDKWSCILFAVESETETDAEGKPVVEMKQYFIVNECIAEENVTEAVTE